MVVSKKISVGERGFKYLIGYQCVDKIIKLPNIIVTNFYNDKLTQKGSSCVCESIILIDSVFKSNEHYYPKCN